MNSTECLASRGGETFEKNLQIIRRFESIAAERENATVLQFRGCGLEGGRTGGVAAPAHDTKERVE